MTSRSALVRYGSAGLGAATLCLGLPLALSPSPASAQQASPSCPSPSATPSSSASATVTPSASATATASTSPAPVATIIGALPIATPTVTTSATPTMSTSPSATPTASTSPSATATATTSPSPCPTSTVPASQNLGISVSPSTITPGQAVVVTVTGTPGTQVELLAYSRPSTQFRTVRTGVIPADGSLEFRVTPGTNTRLVARIAGSSRDADSRSVVINVRTALSLTVVRNGTRDYTFQGRILPRRAGQLITLYRVESSGREVLTSQIRTDSSGTYRIRRVFTGSGRFGFLTRTGQNLNNAAGVSNNGRARPTAVF